MATPLSLVGALYTGSTRGLDADMRATRGLGAEAFPVCTALVMASHGSVTDVTEVPADTVRAQLEHLTSTVNPQAMKIGVLGHHQSVEAVFRFAESYTGSVVLDFVISGPSGETVLTERGIDTVVSYLGIPDLVLLSRQDAELVSGGEIQSLDDAQVAAQRIQRRGARRVLIKCGVLPVRFFEAVEDPGGDGHPEAFMTDLYYDGTDFALFEAPVIEGDIPEGAASMHAVAMTLGLQGGSAPEEAIQRAKQIVTDFLRVGVSTE